MLTLHASLLTASGGRDSALLVSLQANGALGDIMAQHPPWTHAIVGWMLEDWPSGSGGSIACSGGLHIPGCLALLQAGSFLRTPSNNRQQDYLGLVVQYQSLLCRNILLVRTVGLERGRMRGLVRKRVQGLVRRKKWTKSCSV